MRHFPWIAVVVCLLAGCQGDKNAPPAVGPVAPTVAGGGEGATFADYQAGRKAFTRRSESEILEATLEDASWLRFEGSAEDVQARHRAYFEYGYTSFQIVLRAKEFTRPTDEIFILEDSQGARASNKPVSFQGNLTLVQDRWQYTFDLSFQHTITSDTQWLKLTRAVDGSFVQWQFQR